MQNQLNRTEVQAITSAQSLASVQTLLKAGLGCITFMRDLLPNDNFTESHFVTSEDAPSQVSDSFSSLDLRQKKNVNVNGFKIMTMTRGYTDEADRLMNYLEYGVFDALQRHYLRTFTFAVYLDSKDPNNIVEAYTFNFQYHTLPGTDTTVPVMTLDAEGKGTPRQRRMKDPVAEAVSKGKMPTLRDVKRSVKTLLKTLITSMTQMDVLPKRRFASFKMFYTDETPSDYEPPHFQAADADKDKWYFMTHDLDEVPDKWNVGKVDTGHHAVNVSVTSIATYLPSSTEHDSAPFTGTTTKRMLPATLTPAEEAALRLEQATKQKEDAEQRNIVWAADGLGDVDADGEDAQDFVQQRDGTYVLKDTEPCPVGIRNGEGNIDPLPADAMQVDEAVFGGKTQPVPTNLKDMLPNKTSADVSMVDATQPVDQTPTPKARRTNGPPSSFGDDLLNFSPIHPIRNNRNELDTPCPAATGRDDDIDTQMLEKLVLTNDAIDDCEMLDMETQIMNLPSSSMPPESIQSFGRSPERKVIQKYRSLGGDDDIVKCECAITLEDGCSFCEGGCARWYHVWCMGYHSVQDPRLPDSFVCFDCRLRADPSWDLLKVGLYPTIISKFRELASFRRAIKIAEKHNPETAAQFTKLMGCENNLGKQIFKRLENENFIVEHEMVVDDIGFAESRARGAAKGKGKSAKGKQTKTRRTGQKSRFIFNYQMTYSKEYSDYFNPSHEVESRFLGLTTTPTARPSMMIPSPTIERPLHDTQTQDYETQAAALKRNRPEDTSRPKKKVKVSIAPAVDLAE